MSSATALTMMMILKVHGVDLRSSERGSAISIRDEQPHFTFPDLGAAAAMPAALARGPSWFRRTQQR
jgi:hypothetical protein